MRAINEDEAELVIEEHLRTQGWNLTDFTLTRKRWREHLDGEEADRVFLHDGKIAAILEAKKPGKIYGWRSTKPSTMPEYTRGTPVKIFCYSSPVTVKFT